MVARSIASNLILPGRSGSLPSSIYVESAPSVSDIPLDGLLVGNDPGRGTQRSMQPGKAYNFDGSDDVIDLGSALNLGGDNTFSAWVRTTDTNWGLVGNTGSDYLLYYITDTFYFRGGTTGGPATFGTYTLADEWMHLAVTRTGSTIGFWINGIEQTVSGTVASGPDTTFQYIGQVTVGPMAGKLADVRAYDSVLSTSEIRELATLGTDALPNKATVLHLKCDDTHETVAFDSSGNGNDGTKTSITASTFHFESSSPSDHTPFSFENDKGFGYFMIKESGGSTYQGYRSVEQVTDGVLEQVYSEFNKPFAIISQLFGFSADASGDNYDSVEYGFFTGGGDIRVYESGTIQYETTYTEGDVLRIEKTGSTVVYKINGTTVYINSSATTDPVKVHGTAFHLDRVQGYPTLDGGAWTLDDDQDRWVRRAFPRDESDKTKAIFGQPLIYSGPCPRNTQLTKSNCATFDGTDDIADADFSQITGYPFTMMARVRPTTGALGTVCAITDRNDGSYYYAMGYDDGDRVYCAINSAGLQDNLVTVDAISDDVHIAVVFVSETRVKFYRNGELMFDKTDFTSVPFPSANIDSYVVGATRISSPTSYYPGAVWDFRLYSDEQTQAQLRAIALDGDYSTTNMAVGLPMAEGAGSVHYDVSGNGNDAAISGHAESTYFGSTQDVFHWNRAKGFSKRQNKWGNSSNVNGYTEDDVTTSVVAGPFGESNALRIVPSDTALSTHRIYETTGAAGGDYVIAYYKLVGTEHPNLAIQFTGGSQVTIDNATDAAEYEADGGVLVNIRDIGDGWKRATMRMDSVNTGTIQVAALADGTTVPGTSWTPTNTTDGLDVLVAVVDDPETEPFPTTSSTQVTSAISAPALADLTGDAVVAGHIQHAASINRAEGEIDHTGGVAYPVRDWSVRDNDLLYDADATDWLGWAFGATKDTSDLIESPRGRYEAIEITNLKGAAGERLTEVITLSTNLQGVRPWTFGVWVKGEGAEIGQELTIFINRSGATTSIYNTASVVLTAEWQWLEVSTTAASDTTAIKMGITNPDRSEDADAVRMSMPKFELWHVATANIAPDRNEEDLETEWELPKDQLSDPKILDDAAFWLQSNVASNTEGGDSFGKSYGGFEITSNTTTTHIRNATAITTKANKRYLATVDLKEGDDTRSTVAIFNASIATQIAGIRVNWTSGIPTVEIISSSGTEEFSWFVDLGSGWYRFYLSFLNDSNTDARFLFYPSGISGTGSTYISNPTFQRHYINPLFHREVYKNAVTATESSELLVNTTFAGADAGTPGTPPTSWPFTYFSSGTTVSAGTSTIRYSATANRHFSVHSLSVSAYTIYEFEIDIEVNSGTVHYVDMFGTSSTPAGSTTAYYLDGVRVVGASSAQSGRLKYVLQTGSNSGTLEVRFGIGITGSNTGDVTFSNVTGASHTYAEAGVLHRADRIVKYSQVLTGLRLDAAEQYTTSTTV